jgi:hypothetical protein
MKPKTIAIILGVLGLIGMFFFPSPQENFLYYIGFIAIIVALIILVLKFWK